MPKQPNTYSIEEEVERMEQHTTEVDPRIYTEYEVIKSLQTAYNAGKQEMAEEILNNLDKFKATQEDDHTRFILGAVRNHITNLTKQNNETK